MLTRVAAGLIVAGVLAACLGEDGPAFLYRLQVRNETGSLRFVVPLSGIRTDANSVAYRVEPREELWLSSEPLAGSVAQAKILVIDQNCGQVGQVELKAPSADENEPIPAYLVVVNDPTSVTATGIAPPAAGARVAASLAFADLCPAA